MKYLPFFLLFILGCGHKRSGPKIFIPLKIINVGTIQMNAHHKGSFVIKNTGDEDLKIKGITSDCECTVVKNYDSTIAPNQSEKIDFVFTPHVSGYDQQNIFIKNDSPEENVLVMLRAKVEL